jgi:branched-chain amino acid transport system substrate-binding protein
VLYARIFMAMAFLVALFGIAPSSAAPNPFKMDVILSLTGSGAFLGQSEQKMLVSLQQEVNHDGGISGRPIQFDFYDDQTNPTVAIQLSNTILARKPAIVFGTSLSSVSRAMAPLFANGPVNYSFSPVVEPPRGSYVFSASIGGVNSVEVTLRYFRSRGFTRIAALTTTEASGQSAKEDIAELLKQPEFKGLTLVADERMNVSDTSAAAQIARLKAAAPQALMLWTTGTALGTALRGLQDVGLELPTATSSANMNFEQLKQYVSFMPKEMYFQGLQYIPGSRVTKGADVADLARFDHAMKSANVPIDYNSGLAWDPAMIVIQAFRKLGTGATGEQLHAYIESLEYQGITGKYDFRTGNQRGLDASNINIVRWDPKTMRFTQVSEYGGVAYNANRK